MPENEKFETLLLKVMSIADSEPDRRAVAFKKEILTYGELKAHLMGAASILDRMGIKAGDHVLFSAVSKPEMPVIYLALQYLHAVAVFIDKNSTPENAAFIYDDTKAKLFLTDKPMKEYADGRNISSLKAIYEKSSSVDNTLSAYVLPDKNDISEIIYTSGTTGKPKGAMLSCGAVFHILKNTIKGVGLLPEDVVLLPLPLNHSFALRVLRAALYNGSFTVLQNGFTFAKELENNMNAFGCTGIAMVPASVQTVKKQMQGDFVRVFSRFRYLEAGAGALTLEQKKTLVKELPNTRILNTWGSSESGGAIFLDVTGEASNEKTILSLGKPAEGVEVKITDNEGKEINSDHDHPGRMALRGGMQMSGYTGRPEETAKTLRDGWLITGDMAYIEDGYVYMLGRADDIINTGGEKVSPVEVENIAGGYEGIEECACAGVPDPEGVLGYVPALFLVPGNNYDEKELVSYLSSKMERYKIPSVFVKLTEIPRNRMKKIDRKKLKEIWEDKDSRELMNPVIQNILSRRSIRQFKDDEIPENILKLLVKTAYHAPSGHNMQTWQFTVINDKENIERLKKAAAKAAAANKVYFYGFENPAALILVSNDSRNVNGCQDASAAAQNIMLAACSLGIGSVWLNPLMTLRDKEPVKSLLDEFGIPSGHIIWSTVALGYPLADGKRLAKKENVVRWVKKHRQQQYDGDDIIKDG